MSAWNLFRRTREPKARGYFHAVGWVIEGHPNPKQRTRNYWRAQRDVLVLTYVYQVELEHVVDLIMEVLHPSDTTIPK